MYLLWISASLHIKAGNIQIVCYRVQYCNIPIPTTLVIVSMNRTINRKQASQKLKKKVQGNFLLSNGLDLTEINEAAPLLQIEDSI